MGEGDKLYDFGGYPEISAQGVADVHFLHSDCRIILFDWYKCEGIWQRRVVATIKRPICTLTAEQRHQWREAAQSRPPPEFGLVLH